MREDEGGVAKGLHPSLGYAAPAGLAGELNEAFMNAMFVISFIPLITKIPVQIISYQ